MYGLRKIIQIDGFIPNIRTVIDVDGHSIINGTNGAGKTTTLKLLSFFYGSDPSQLYSRTSVQVSFVDFYLPRQTSILIFEYQRESGACCVVAYRHRSGTKHAYRFLEGGFSEARFSEKDADGNSVYCKGYRLKDHWEKLGLEHSKQIELVTDYRGVIQNDESLLKRPLKSSSPHSRDLQKLAALYCLVGRKTKMKYIERICSIISARRGNMDRLKEMLAQIMEDKKIAFPQNPTHKDDAGLVKEIESMREFEKEIPKMKHVLELHYERLDVISQLSSHAGQIKRTELDIRKGLEETNREIDNSNTQMDLLDKEWESLLRDLHDQIIGAESAVGRYENEIDQLDTEYDNYEKQDMDQKATDFDNLNRFIEQESLAIDRVTKLNEEVSGDKSIKDKALLDEAERYERLRKNTQKKLDITIETLRSAENEYNSKRADIISDQDDVIDAVRADSSSEKEQLVDARARAKAVAELGGPTEEEKKGLYELQHRLTGLEKEVNEQRSVLDAQNAALEKARNDRENADLAFLKAKQDLERKKDHLEALHKLVHAEDGTLLHHLRENKPDWVRNLGKVINPVLLQRKDMHPEYTGEGEEADTIFGWLFNMQAVPVPQHAEAVLALQNEYDAQDRKVEDAKAIVSKRQADFSTANKKYKETGRDVLNAKLELQNKTKQLKLVRESLLDRQRDIDEGVSTRRIAAKKDIDRLSKEIQAFDDRLAKRIEGLRESHSQDLNQLLADHTIEVDRIEKEKERLSNELETLIIDHKQRKKQIIDDFIKACSDKGVDGGTIEDAENDVTKAKERVRSISDNAPSVHRYRYWLNNQWPQRELLAIKVRELTATHNGLKDNAEQEKHSYQQNKEALKKGRSKARSRLIYLNDQKQQMDTILRHFSVYMEKTLEPSVEAKPFDLLIREVESLLESHEQLKHKLVGEMSQVDRKILKHDETQVGLAWLRRKDDLKKALNSDDTTDYYLTNLPQALEPFIDEDVSSIRQAMIESLRSAGKGLNDFLEHLKDTHTGIMKESKNITSSIQEGSKIDALTSISISMKSTVDHLECWKYIHGFSESWQAWLDSEERGFPDNDVIADLSSLIENVKNIKADSQLGDYFDLSIRIVENGTEKIITSNNDLDDFSSDGLRYLALCAIFIAISRSLCPDKRVTLHWPIDELGTLHGENIAKLFKMLDKENIVMLAGFPSEDPAMLSHFKHRQIIDIKKGVRVIDIPESILTARAAIIRNRGHVNENIS